MTASLPSRSSLPKLRIIGEKGKKKRDASAIRLFPAETIVAQARNELQYTS